MAKFYVGKGLDEYLAQLGNLEFEAPDMIGKAIYPGAKLVADGIREAIRALPIDNTPGRVMNGVRTVEQTGLLEGLGVATMQNDNGYFNVKIGMDGYNRQITEKYPNGHPNAMVARSIESGTSFMQRIPFINNTTRRLKKAAEKVMADTIDKEIKSTMK